MNPLYSQMNQNPVMQRFQQFQRIFKGNPQEQVQQLLNSGKVSQADFNKAVQIAQEFQRMFTGKV